MKKSDTELVYHNFINNAIKIYCIIKTYANFSKKENGAVLMDDELRKKFLTEWQNRKKEVITHPYLREKVEWGMVPYVQAMLLARYFF